MREPTQYGIALDLFFFHFFQEIRRIKKFIVMPSWCAQTQGACEDPLDHSIFGDKQNRNRDICKVGICNMKKVHIIFGMR